MFSASYKDAKESCHLELPEAIGRACGGLDAVEIGTQIFVCRLLGDEADACDGFTRKRDGTDRIRFWLNSWRGDKKTKKAGREPGREVCAPMIRAWPRLVVRNDAIRACGSAKQIRRPVDSGWDECSAFRFTFIP